MRDAMVLSSGPDDSKPSPLGGINLLDWVRPWLKPALGVFAGLSTMATAGTAMASVKPAVPVNNVAPTRTTLDSRPRATSDNPSANANHGPFREGMTTSFTSAPVINREMAELMNLHYQTLRQQNFTENCSTVFTLHMVKESTGGLHLMEESNSNGVGTIQFSQWNGKGTGRELSWLRNPDTGTAWQRNDLISKMKAAR